MEREKLHPEWERKQASYVRQLALAEKARMEMVAVLREALAAGVSAVEVGKVLGISRQRVHQLTRRKIERCTGCGEPRTVGLDLWAGRDVRVCNDCTGAMRSILGLEGSTDSAAWASAQGFKEAAEDECSFCQRRDTSAGNGRLIGCAGCCNLLASLAANAA